MGLLARFRHDHVITCHRFYEPEFDETRVLQASCNVLTLDEQETSPVSDCDTAPVETGFEAVVGWLPRSRTVDT